MTVRLTAKNLTVFRGERCLFSGLDFALSAGEALLLEGRNGSGKTSLLRAVAGLLEPESGKIRWNGVPVKDEPQLFRNDMVWMSHKPAFKSDLTLIENLRYESRLRPQSAAEFPEVLKRLELTRLKSLPLRLLSTGQQRRVALARLVLASAALWLMDEPAANLDHDGRKLVLQLVREHLSRGGMAIMAVHEDLHIDAPVQRVRLQ